MSPTTFQLLVILLAGWINREQQKVIDYLRTENDILREQLGGRPRFTDSQRRRLAAAGCELGRKLLLEIGSIVTPDTILRWYRRLIARKYDGSGQRPPGRPPKPDEIRELVVRMAGECPTWGYTRIRDAMRNLGHDVARSTVKKILEEHGILPAPERGSRTSWNDFLAAQWQGLAACDFFSVEVMTLFGLIRYQVFFVMHLATRRVEIVGIAHDPGESWMMQVARNLVDCVDGFLRDKSLLILDRDPLFTKRFRNLLRGAGVRPLPLPSRSPNLNAYAERFVLSVRRECLDRLIIFGEPHLRLVLAEYTLHYHSERNHQGLGGRLIEFPGNETRSGPVECRKRLGGLLRYYHRKAA